MYDVSFLVVPQVDAYQRIDGWLFAIDGSCQAREGGYSVVVRTPATLGSRIIIRRAYVSSPCTNTKAEILALTEAFRMICALQEHSPLSEVSVMSDSLFCIQLLHGAVSSVANVAEVAALMNSWGRVRDMVSLRHVKGHAGEFHNCMADFHAGYAREHRLTAKETFDLSDPLRLLPSDDMWLRELE